MGMAHALELFPIGPPPPYFMPHRATRARIQQLRDPASLPLVPQGKCVLSTLTLQHAHMNSWTSKDHRRPPACGVALP